MIVTFVVVNQFIFTFFNLLCFDQVKEHVEIKAERKFTIFKAVSMTSQVVAGTNYFVKVSSIHHSSQVLSNYNLSFYQI